jgi:DNA polymerase eta
MLIRSSHSVGGFEDGIVGNMGIGAFLVKKDEAKAVGMAPAMGESAQERPEKRRRIEPFTGIERFFKTDSTDEHDDEFGSQYLPGIDTTLAEVENADSKDNDEAALSNSPHDNEATKGQKKGTLSIGPPATHQQRIKEYMCDQCSMALESADALQSHQDWHFAMDLENEERTRAAPKVSGPTHSKNPANRKKGGRSSKPEKNQSKLAFG